MKILFLPFLLGYMLTIHAYHISVSEVKFISDEKSIQFSTRIFLDDLEEGLSITYPTQSIDVLNPDDQKKLNRMIEDYVLRNIGIKINSKPISMTYIGNRQKEDVMVCYIEVKDVKRIEKIEIRNTLLFNKYTDQLNLIHITNDGTTKTLKLDKSHFKETITF